MLSKGVICSSVITGERGTLRFRKEDLGKWLLPPCWSLCSSSILSSVLMAFLCPRGRGSWCTSDVIGHRLGVQVKVRDGDYLCFIHNTFSFPGIMVFLALQYNSPTGKAIRCVFDSEARWAQSWQNDRYQGKMWYQLALEQEGEISICTDGNSNSQKSMKTEYVLWALLFFFFFSFPVACALLVRTHAAPRRNGQLRGCSGQLAWVHREQLFPAVAFWSDPK